MLQIRDRSKVPNGLYTYTPEGMQQPFKAHGFGLLVLKVREYLVANNRPVPENLAQIVEQDWCNRRPEHCEDPQAIEAGTPQREHSDAFTNLLASLAVPTADALAKISDALGISCSRCKTRHRIIREMKKRGFTETMKRLKETLA